jgi:uncharacterized RDD family membrane protein YckC
MSKKFPKNFASFRARFVAGVIDTAILAPIFLLLIYFFGASEYEMLKIDEDFQGLVPLDSESQNRLIDYISYMIAIVYLTYFLSRTDQATLGKKIAGIYVGNVDGSKLTWQRALYRALASILTACTLGIGFLFVLFTKEKTALHDVICKTRVFYRNKK